MNNIVIHPGHGVLYTLQLYFPEANYITVFMYGQDVRVRGFVDMSVVAFSAAPAM